METIKGLENTVYSEQKAYEKEFSKRRSQLKNLRHEAKATPGGAMRYKALQRTLQKIEHSRPSRPP